MATNADKVQYLMYRINEARKILEESNYKHGALAYRHLNKALFGPDHKDFLGFDIPKKEEAASILEQILSDRIIAETIEEERRQKRITEEIRDEACYHGA